jgi:hypothetical protein
MEEKRGEGAAAQWRADWLAGAGLAYTHTYIRTYIHTYTGTNRSIYMIV